MKINNYTYEIVKDHSTETVGVLVRYQNNDAIFIPLLDIILRLEKIK